MILSITGNGSTEMKGGAPEGKTLAREKKLRKSDLAGTASLINPEDLRSVPMETRGSSRTEKTARIREQIRQGTYHVSATEVARAILQSASSREFPKKKGK